MTTLDEAFELATASQKSRLMINEQSGRAAVKLPASGLMQDDGTVQPRVRLLRPAASGSRQRRSSGALALARGDLTGVSTRLGGRSRRPPGIHREHVPYRHRPAASRLEPPARRDRARLSSANRRRRAHHRPARLAGERRRPRRDAQRRGPCPVAERGARCRHAGWRQSRSRRGARSETFARDEPPAARAYRLLGHALSNG